MSTTEYEIERDILIEAPVEVVWRTVTEPDQMSLWFADKVDLEVKPGAHGYMGFGEQGGPVVVEAVEPPIRFSFRWNHPAGEEPTPSNSLLVEFLTGSYKSLKTHFVSVRSSISNAFRLCAAHETIPKGLSNACELGSLSNLPLLANSFSSRVFGSRR